MEYAEAYVRRMLASTVASSRRRAWVREQPWGDPPDLAGDSPELPVLDRSLLWPLVCALPAQQRAVIVLRYYEDLSEAEIADVLGPHFDVRESAPPARSAERRQGLELLVRAVRRG